jgi:hypothetical protein
MTELASFLVSYLMTRPVFNDASSTPSVGIVNELGKIMTVDGVRYLLWRTRKIVNRHVIQGPQMLKAFCADACCGVTN